MKDVIQLYQRVLVPTTNSTTVTVAQKNVVALNRELSTMGYTMGVDVLNGVSRLSPGQFKKFRASLLDEVISITGANGNHQTLYRDFPYDVPDQDDYLRRRISGWFQNIYGNFSNKNYQPLSCGHIIDLQRFPDLDKFGMCPICQFQVNDLPYDPPSEKVKYDRTTPLKVLHVANDKFLSRAGSALIARMSSLSPQERTFVEYLRQSGIALDKPTGDVFRETLPLVYDLFNGEVEEFIKSGTDVLRLAYYVSDKTADLSLAKNVRFRLPSSHKKRMIRFLDKVPNLAEDLMRDRERWLRFGEHVHIGSFKNRYPNVVEAFQTLRNAPQSIYTFNRVIEKGIRGRNVNSDFLDTLETRPGEFMRKLDFMLRNKANNSASVRNALGRVLPRVQTKMLLEVGKYLEFRKTDNANRVFVVKGDKNTIHVVDDTRAKIKDTDLTRCNAMIKDELSRRFSGLPKMGKVYIDPTLKNIVLPYNRRGDSNATSQVMKGSRYKMSNSPVIRMFVHWTGHVDVDLSMTAFDKDMNYITHVGFTSLYDRDKTVVHSGDVQNAPNGASEFIDIDVENFRASRNVRYIAMNVYSYRGDGFNSFPCYAGFMERDTMRSGRQYEPSSVKYKFDLTAEVVSYMPLMFDLETNEIIYADFAMKGRYFMEARQQSKNTAILLKGIVDMTSRKPTVYDLLHLHAVARGKTVNDPAKADIVFNEKTDPLKVVDEYFS